MIVPTATASWILVAINVPPQRQFRDIPDSELTPRWLQQTQRASMHGMSPKARQMRRRFPSMHALPDPGTAMSL